MMLLLDVTLAFILLQTVSCRRAPQILSISNEQINEIGSSVEFVCDLEDVSIFPVLWMKKDNYYDNTPLLISNDSTLIVKDSRYAVAYSPRGNNMYRYILEIKDIQETDAGIYQCQIDISSNYYAKSKYVELLVRTSPVISDNSTRSLIVSEGEPVELQCYASGGYPTSRISWRRENNIILPTGRSIHYGNTLKIKSIREEDIGTYYCLAKNGVEPEAKHPINLKMQIAAASTDSNLTNPLDLIFENIKALKSLHDQVKRELHSSYKVPSVDASNDINNLTNKLSTIDAEISFLNRAGRLNNIVIFNLEENQKNDEDLISTVSSLFQKLNITIPDLAIADAFRLGKSSNNRPILVKFIAPRWVKTVLAKTGEFDNIGLSVSNDLSSQDA